MASNAVLPELLNEVQWLSELENNNSENIAQSVPRNSVRSQGDAPEISNEGSEQALLPRGPSGVSELQTEQLPLGAPYQGYQVHVVRS